VKYKMSNETLEKAIAANTTATGTFASTTGGTGVHRATEDWKRWIA
jgi:hypothetical protein